MTKWTDWIDHIGDTCPIPKAKVGEYEVKFQNNEIHSFIPAKEWNWKDSSFSRTIVAYRTKIMKPKKIALFALERIAAFTLDTKTSTRQERDHIISIARNALQEIEELKND